MFEKLFAQSGLSLDRLRSFAEIVAAGGITAAAGDDSNRQSQYSRQLKELERYFGAELIQRGRGRRQLTAAGENLHRIATYALSALEELRQTCANQPVDLVVGAGESLIHWLLLPRLSALTTAHPHLHLTLQNLRTAEILHGLAEGSLDFGVVSRLDAHRALRTTPLGRLDYALFLPAGLVHPGRKLQFPSAVLDNLPLATLSGSPWLRQALEDEAQQHHLRLDVRLRFSSYPQLAQALQTMKVAAIMPTLAAPALAAGTFRLVRLPFLDARSRQLCLAWNGKLAEVRPAINTYAKALATVFRQTPDRS
jgi:DNA-binding transcriptional LysR family regulator